MTKVEGNLPIAVTTKLKLYYPSLIEENLTLLKLMILAPSPCIEYLDRTHSGLLKVKSSIDKSVYED